jgi:ATP-dependent Clp protease ATP-binding subunit ClpC
MFDRFTERARKTIVLAREEALRFRHDALDCEHLLLGLLEEGKGVGITALRRQGIDLQMLKHDLEHRMSRGGWVRKRTDIPFTSSSKDVLRIAVELSRELGHHYVGSEHLLLALLREGRNLGALALKDHGVTEESLFEQVEILLGESVQQKRKKKTAFKVLKQFSTDLTQLAEEDKIDPVIGRTQEIGRIIQILCRRTKNNPILLGEPGVGKTAIVEGLA